VLSNWLLYSRLDSVVHNGSPPANWLKALVTPVPKKIPPTDFSHLRPISVTPIMSRVTERLIVHKYLLPALPSRQILDQFAYKPTGSTTAALIDITHHISRLLESSSSSFVRCILIDFHKAFDTVNRAIFLQKREQLRIPSNVLLFFMQNSGCIFFWANLFISWLPISQSIIQGSGMAPISIHGLCF